MLTAYSWMVMGVNCSRLVYTDGLGVLAFELLTGRPPYLGTPMNVLCALLEEDVPPPSRHAQGVPAALDAIVPVELTPPRRGPSSAVS